MRIEIHDKKDCCGCTACANVCPKKCINMKEDEEGFRYPEIDLQSCIDCGLCSKVCPIKKEKENASHTPEVFSCMNTDETIRLQSSSGGMFYLFAEKLISEGGKVYGAAFDNEAEVYHEGTETKEGLMRLLGSKYVQSNMGTVFTEIEKDLKENRKVLFSGTPCQCAGLKSYLRKEYENLYTVDFICHGAPSPAVWKKYLKALKKKMQCEYDKDRTPSFRDKTEGWIKFSLLLPLKNKEDYRRKFGNDLYMRTFLKDVSLRPSCYHCSFKPSTNISDITMGDFWGIKKIMPQMFDDKGTSLIFINSEKGKEMFEKIAAQVKKEPVEYSLAVKHNSAAYRSVQEPPMRKVFFENLEKEDILELMQKCTKESFIKRCLKSAYHMLRR